MQSLITHTPLRGGKIPKINPLRDAWGHARGLVTTHSSLPGIAPRRHRPPNPLVKQLNIRWEDPVAPGANWNVRKWGTYVGVKGTDAYRSSNNLNGDHSARPKPFPCSPLENILRGAASPDDNTRATQRQPPLTAHWTNLMSCPN